MPTSKDKGATTKDVESARSRVQKLREELDELNADLITSEEGRNNAVRVARLDAEEQSLKDQIAAVKAALKTSGQADRVTDQIASGGETLLPADEAESGAPTLPSDVIKEDVAAAVASDLPKES